MYTLPDLQKIIADKIKNINLKNSPEGLYEPVDYILSLGGKRLRPALVLASYNMYKNDIENAVDAALAFEIFHNFTLLHDDIMDNSALRRGNKTVHVKWNPNTAILSGDAMMILAYGYILNLNNNVIRPVFELFNKTALEVCEGQQFDMNFENSFDVNIEQYIKMIELKTSVLIAACAKTGAILADASDSDAELLYEFGLNIGKAFQLQDDLLDVYADTEVFGKQTGGDIVEAKKTFLLITALKNADKSQKQILINLLNDKSLERNLKVKSVTEIYNSLNIGKITSDIIEFYYNKALEALKKVNVPEQNKIVLLNFADSLKLRKN